MRNSLLKTVVFTVLVATGASIILAAVGLGNFFIGLPIGMWAAVYSLDHELEWIRRCPPGRLIPNGIVLREDSRDHLWELMLLLPVFIIWRSRHYRIDNDDYQRGWFVVKMFARIGKAWGPVIDVRFALGLSPTRWVKDAWSIRAMAKSESAKVLQDD